MKSFTARELVALLHEGALKAPLVVSGMVKQIEDSNYLLIDLSGACSRWIRLPVEMIAEQGVKWFGKRVCKDHVHDYVELTLKSPNSPEASVLADLLASLVSNNTTTAPGVHDALSATQPAVDVSHQLVDSAGGVRLMSAPRTHSLPSPRGPLPALPRSLNLDGYGNWCGTYNTGRGWNDPPPIDGLDQACMEHDMDIKTHGYHRCYADNKLITPA